MNTTPAVAVTGIGCMCRAGNTLGACMDTLFGERILPAAPKRFGATHPVTYPVFEVDDDLAFLRPKGKENISRTAKMGLVVAYEAIRDAGIDPDLLRTKRVGVCMGTTVGSAMNNEVFYRQYYGGEETDMGPIRRFLNSNPAATVAREFDLTGPCQTVVNACSSGTDAVGIGAMWIRSGLCDVVLAGGSDELCHVTYNGFISLMITDSSPCKPFDANRKGLNLGEGAAILVLESEAFLRARRKQARAFVLGYGASCDAYHLTAPHPEGKGLKRAIKEAMSWNEASPADIAFVNAHGTGTPDNDKVESTTLSALLPKVPFVSTKGFTGHTLGAAGAIEAAFTVACLERGRIPKNAGFTTADPDLASSPVDRETSCDGRIALSESLAFGGHNAVLALGLPGGDV